MSRRPNPETLIDGVPYQERRERFCGHFVESNGNRMQAYRLAFVVDPEMANREVFARANELLADPEVIERINEMRETAAAATLVTVSQIMQDWADIATADPNELTSYIRTACRCCWGIDNKFQWIDEAEYLRACKDQETLPDISGGMGYDEYRDPNPRCKASGCAGKGIGQPWIADTRKLTPQARKLYAGTKVTKNGIEIMMHSQEKARENLARCYGAFKDAVAQPSIGQSKPLPVPSPEDAQRTYLQVIQGGK